LERFNQVRPQRKKFLQMKLRKPIEHFLAAACDLKAHAPAISFVRHAAKQPLVFTTVDQLNGAIVLQPQQVCRVSDRRTDIRRSARHREKKLMLLGVESGLVNGFFARQQICPQLMPEFRQRPMQRLERVTPV
jgi:hypothetical protein